jgi:hypothetical protein
MKRGTFGLALMRSFGPSVTIATLVSALAPACQEQGAVDHKTSALVAAPSGALNGGAAVGASLGVYHAYWPHRTDTELANRIQAVAGLIRQTTPPRLTKTDGLREIRSTPFDDPTLEVTYREPADDLTVTDKSLLPSTQPAQDIGENAARVIAAQSVAALYRAGLASPGQYSTLDFGTGHHRRGEGSGANPANIYVVEYRFRALRKLNGIDVANNGLVIGVSPSGQLSSIRIGGAQVDSIADGTGEKPTAAGRVFARAVDDASIDARFAADIVPNGKKAVLSRSIMYVVPRKVTDALIEPVVVYRYAEQFPSGAIEPAHTIGYSLEDATKAPRDLDAE